MNQADLETKVITKIQSLRKLLPSVHKEIELIRRREEVKQKLLYVSSKPNSKEKYTLATELRRLTSTLKVALSAWHRYNQQPLKIRGVDYLQILHGNY
jgi:hypothetical protein